MRTSKSSSTKTRAASGKILTTHIRKLRKTISALTSSKTPARAEVAAKRLQTILTGFRTRVKKLAKSSNGSRH